MLNLSSMAGEGPFMQREESLTIICACSPSDRSCGAMDGRVPWGHPEPHSHQRPREPALSSSPSSAPFFAITSSPIWMSICFGFMRFKETWDTIMQIPPPLAPHMTIKRAQVHPIIHFNITWTNYSSHECLGPWVNNLTSLGIHDVPFMSLWTYLTALDKFKDQRCILRTKFTVGLIHRITYKSIVLFLLKAKTSSLIARDIIDSSMFKSCISYYDY